MTAIAELDSLAAKVAAQKSRLLKEIEALVQIESPSDDPAAVNQAVDLVEHWCAQMGGRIKRHSDRNALRKKSGGRFGDVLEARFPTAGTSRSKEKPILLLGHLDTVWAKGTLATMPVRKHQGWLFGPGVYDMKAGVAMALTALRALMDNGLLNQPVTLLLVSDEEVGSPFSRPITEKIALQSSAVYVLEPAQGPQGAYKTARKGVGEYRLTVRGVASHSGVDFAAGHSAVVELARQIDRVANFTEVDRGLTVNPGVIAGGTRSNVVAAEAWAAIDVRIPRKADAARIEKKLKSLKRIDPACSLSITGGINRPPMERTPGTVALFKRAATLAKAAGFDLEEAATGGGSDGNFTSALGLPTLDGMGAVGHGAHASDESILIDALVPRTVLLAAMLLRRESGLSR
jgi:glutamate carboxypeptidase